MTTIYEPRGKAKEYGDYAINIYTGCPHECFYCYSPQVLHKSKDAFHGDVRPRPGIVEATKAALERNGLTDRLVHLCFTCDPYPTGYDSSATREIIKLLKETGNHVQILTKGDGRRDFDLLDENDWYGITIDGQRDYTGYMPKLNTLQKARMFGINTWVSFEPVLNAENVLNIIRMFHADFNRVKIGKLNYYPSDINWKAFGWSAEQLCKSLGLDYYIKESLRKEMES